jgi:hypothetical protein
MMKASSIEEPLLDAENDFENEFQFQLNRIVFALPGRQRVLSPARVSYITRQVQDVTNFRVGQ